MPIKQVILNTGEAQDAFAEFAKNEIGGGRGGSDVVINCDDLAALKQGMCIAFDNGEFSTFITLDQDALIKS